jgi:hypothetical protein
VNGWALRPLPISAMTAGSTVAGYDPASVMNDYLGVVWRGSGTTPYLQADLGSAQAVDAVLMFGCTDATAGMTVQITGADNAAITLNPVVAYTGTFLAGANFPTHGRGVGYAEFAAPITKRYWYMQFGSVPGGGFSVGRLVLGSRLLLARNFDFGAGFGLRDLGSADVSNRANLLRRRGPKLRTVGVTYSNIYKDEVIAKVQPLIEFNGATEPIVLVTDPAADADRQKRAYFGLMTGDLGTIQRNSVGFQWKAQLTDLVPIPKAS